MRTVSRELGDATLRAENIGGIDETEVTFEPGLTVLAGRNATNRTSLLQALMAGLGSENVSLKGDADEGQVELTIGDETFSHRIRRHGDGIVTDGDAYLDDPQLADLFAFLLETNEARRTIALGGDLRELIMEPVDTEAIQAEIDQLRADLRDLETELDEVESEQERLPGLEERQRKLEDEIEETEQALEAKEAEIEATDVDIEETREEKAALEEGLDRLQETRSALETVRFQLERERESLATLREEREEFESAAAELPAVDADELDSVEGELDRLRNRKQRVDTEINDLQSVIQFNEEMLDGTSMDVVAALRDDEASGTVTDQLLEDAEAVVCWTCGSEVERTQIESTLERLRDLRTAKFETRNGIQSDIDDLTQERESIQDRQRRHGEVEDNLAQAQDEIEALEGTIEDLEDRREELNGEIDECEAEIENFESQDYATILDLHKEANKLEIKRDRLQDEQRDVVDEIAAVEERLEEKAQIETQQGALEEELADCRTRVEQIEQRAVDEFNAHMETVLELLDYENLARIWIERTRTEVREGRRKVEKSVFTLHVVRSTASGTTYEDSFDHLSESEREVTGFIFALAGYLAHEVYDRVPFILLDSLEALDADRIATLVEYLQDYAGYLVVALLSEDAAALDESYRRVSEI